MKEWKLVERTPCLGTALKRVAGALTCAGLVTVAPAAMAATIGYVVLGAPSNTGPEAPIIAAGHTPRALGTLGGADLSGIDVLWVLNPSNGGYAADYTANQAAVQTFVASGGRLVFHDRDVTGAAAVIPGASAITFLR